MSILYYILSVFFSLLFYYFYNKKFQNNMYNNIILSKKSKLINKYMLSFFYKTKLSVFIVLFFVFLFLNLYLFIAILNINDQFIKSLYLVHLGLFILFVFKFNSKNNNINQYFDDDRYETLKKFAILFNKLVNYFIIFISIIFITLGLISFINAVI
jgi:hypothetical protein